MAFFPSSRTAAWRRPLFRVLPDNRRVMNRWGVVEIKPDGRRRRRDGHRDPRRYRPRYPGTGRHPCELGDSPLHSLLMRRWVEHPIATAQIPGDSQAVRECRQRVGSTHAHPERINMLGTVLLVLLVLMLLGALPTWSHSRSWGYGPSGGIGLVLIVLVVLVLVGRI